MHRHDEVEAILNALEENLSIVDIDVELALECVMHEDACLDVDVVILRVPVGLEGHWHTIPTIGVDMAEAISNALNDALCEDSWL